MAIYLWLYFLSALISFWKKGNLANCLSLFLLVSMGIMCMMRGENVGSDTIHYLRIYESDVAMLRYTNEFVFYGLIQYIKNLGGSEIDCQMVICSLFYIPFIILIITKSRWPTLSVLFFIISTNRYFFETFNISRQMVAIAFSLWAWILLYENKKKFAIICYILACGFHMSTIFSLPIAYLCVKKNFSLKTIYITLGISLFWTFLFSNPVMVSGLLYYLQSFSFIGIDKYVYLDGYRTEMNRTFIGLITLVGPHVFMCILLVLRDRTNLLVKLYYCGVIMLNLVAVLPISYRFALCLTSLELVLIPAIMFNGDFLPIRKTSQLNRFNSKITSNMILYIFVFSVLAYSIYIFCLPSSLTEYVPYKTFN